MCDAAVSVACTRCTLSSSAGRLHARVFLFDAAHARAATRPAPLRAHVMLGPDCTAQRGRVARAALPGVGCWLAGWLAGWLAPVAATLASPPTDPPGCLCRRALQRGARVWQRRQRRRQCRWSATSSSTVTGHDGTGHSNARVACHDGFWLGWAGLAAWVVAGVGVVTSELLVQLGADAHLRNSSALFWPIAWALRDAVAPAT